MIRPSSARRPAWALLFALILLRALVPAGFMIGTAASGAPALVLCPGVEAPPPVHKMGQKMAHKMAVHGPEHRQGHDPATHRESPCPFAALAAPALPPAPPAIAPPPSAPPHAAPQALTQAKLAPGLAAPPPPATGPPAAL